MTVYGEYHGHDEDPGFGYKYISFNYQNYCCISALKLCSRKRESGKEWVEDTESRFILRQRPKVGTTGATLLWGYRQVTCLLCSYNSALDG